MITTTLNAIRAHSPCREGWEKLLRHLGKTQADGEPLPFAVILESNRLDDAVWCCRAAPEHDSVWRLFAVRFARRALARIPDPDPRSVAAVDTAERYAQGAATAEELGAAWAAAAAVADAVADAADDAAVATVATVAAAAADAAWAAWVADAAWAAAAARAEREAQIRDFLELVS